MGRHAVGPGDRDVTDVVDGAPAHGGRRPMPWRLVLAIGIPLGLLAGGIIWAASDPGPESDEPAVVVQGGSTEPTEWVPESDVGLGTAPPVTATPSTTPTGSAEPTPPARTRPPAPPPAVFSAQYAQTSSWSGGFRATLVVAHESGGAGSWEIRLDYPSPDKVTVTDATNATVRVGGGELIFSGGRLAAGEQVTVTFEAEKNRPGETFPTRCSVNGVDCTGV